MWSCRTTGKDDPTASGTYTAAGRVAGGCRDRSGRAATQRPPPALRSALSPPQPTVAAAWLKVQPATRRRSDAFGAQTRARRITTAPWPDKVERIPSIQRPDSPSWRAYAAAGPTPMARRPWPEISPAARPRPAGCRAGEWPWPGRFVRRYRRWCPTTARRPSPRRIAWD